MAFDYADLPEFGVSDAYCINCGGKGTATVNLRIPPREDGRRPALCKLCNELTRQFVQGVDWQPIFKDRRKR